MTTQVQLYVYDLSQGMARALSASLLGTQIDAIWHTGVVIFGKEYFFGGGAGPVSNLDNAMNAGLGVIGDPNTSGVKYCAPGTTILGQPHQVVTLGMTEIDESLFNEYLTELAASTFRADTYSLFEHNCNNFSNEVSQFLTGNPIPDNIVNLPQHVLNTPFGNMLRSMLGGMNIG